MKGVTVSLLLAVLFLYVLIDESFGYMGRQSRRHEHLGRKHRGRERKYRRHHRHRDRVADGWTVSQAVGQTGDYLEGQAGDYLEGQAGDYLEGYGSSEREGGKDKQEQFEREAYSPPEKGHSISGFGHGPSWRSERRVDHDPKKSSWFEGGAYTPPRKHNGRSHHHSPKDWFQKWNLGPRRFEIGIGHSPDDAWFNFDLNFGQWFKEKQWWKGPNVCTSRTEKEKDDTEDGEIQRHTSVHSKICDETDSVYKCVTTIDVFGKRKQFTEVQECCHGYARDVEGKEQGCTQRLDLKDLITTAERLNLTEFLRAVRSVDLTPELRQGNFTVFAPVNPAFQNDLDIVPELPKPRDEAKPFPKIPESNLVLVSRPLTDTLVNDMKQMMLGHVVVDAIKTSEMKDELLLQTGSPRKSTIRINFYDYPHKLVTANCARILKANVQATNGLIHTVERVLSPVTTSLIGLVSKNPELSVLKTLLSKADLVQKLKDADGHYTLFAPTNSAFDKLPKDLKKKLNNGDACLRNIMLHHLLPRVICSAVIAKRVRTTNMLDRYIGLTRDDDEKIFADGVQVTGTDLMATNGVLHLVDEVIIPEDALSILEVAEKNGAKKVVQLIEKAKLLDKFNNLENLTIFAPSDKAFQELDERLSDALEMDQELLTKVLTYHVTDTRHTIGGLQNGQKLSSLYAESKLGINEYFNFPFGSQWVKTVQCAPIVKPDLKACNGIVHIVNEVMQPPTGNVLDVIRSHKDFQSFFKLLRLSGLEEILEDDGPITVLVPTNLALEDIGEVKDNGEQLKAILKNHIIRDTICCSGIFGGRWLLRQQLRTTSGETFPMDRTRDGFPLVDKAQITTCDIMATNGVVLKIDRLLVKRHQVDSREYGRGHQTDWETAFKGWGDFWSRFQ